MGGKRAVGHSAIVASGHTSLTLQKLCPDLNDWARHWCYESRDLVCGQQFAEHITPFLRHLLQSGLAPRALRRHRDYLRLLGAEVIRRIQDDPPLRKQSMPDLLLALLEDDGGPLVYPPLSESDQIAFDGTCRKLFRFLNQQNHHQLDQ
jgi:hypothetical protein